MKRILLADDNDDIRQLLDIFLTKEGHEVVAVHDGAEALRAYGTALRECKPFDLLILDCAMPNMTGTTLSSRVRELCDDIPILFLTARPRSLLADDVARYQIMDVFEKPIAVDALGARVREIVCNG